jgi:hypothetical protein
VDAVHTAGLRGVLMSEFLDDLLGGHEQIVVEVGCVKVACIEARVGVKGRRFRVGSEPCLKVGRHLFDSRETLTTSLSRPQERCILSRHPRRTLVQSDATYDARVLFHTRLGVFGSKW